jgi:antitoxin (DNA-binding transcriptional repressor) of toxin-antitoxin stability system
MKATVLDLRRRMPEVLRALDRHERVTILYRGQERAVLIPANAAGTGTEEQAGKNKITPQTTEHPAFGMWAKHSESEDVPAYVRSIRKSRHHAL